MSDTNLMTKVNEHLAYLYSNGKGEAGLEVGVDAGLPLDQFIQVPQSMKKLWVAQIDTKVYESRYKVHIKSKKWVEGSNISSYIGEPGWTNVGMIRIVGNAKEVQYKVNGVMEWIPMVDFHMEPMNYKDMANFYTVNKNHIGEENQNDNHLMWIHAVRFWSVAGGFVVTDKTTEWTTVPDPKDLDPKSDEFVEFASKFSANAWTACAARATSWKKTNHCTGGTPATGLPRRWLQKENFWPNNIEGSGRHKQEIYSTSAFYVATHSTSVHAVLAQLAPEDSHHWCILNPAYGFVNNWDIGESVRVRMVPKDQIAGAAMVADSMVVLKMLVSEGLAPCLEYKSQIAHLIDAHKALNQYGMLCAVYKSWYFEGYPGILPKVEFSQRDPKYFELINELAIIGVKFYTGSTISWSPSLQNVAKQSSFESIKANWSTAASQRMELTSGDLLKVIEILRGISNSQIVSKLASISPSEQVSAAMDYNSQLDSIGKMLGIDAVKQIDTKNLPGANLFDSTRVGT